MLTILCRKTTYFMLPSDAFAAKSRPAATPSSVRAFSTAAVGRPRSLTPSIDSRRTFFSPAKLALTAAASAITTASLLPRLTTRSPPNYPNHQPINALENAFLAAGSGVVGLLDTRRGDLVALLSETSSQWTIPHLHEAMAADAEGRQILKDRPLLNSSTVDLDKLRELKRGTLGREWVEWLAQSGLTPDTREEVRGSYTVCCPRFAAPHITNAHHHLPLASPRLSRARRSVTSTRPCWRTR